MRRSHLTPLAVLAGILLLSGAAWGADDTLQVPEPPAASAPADAAGAEGADAAFVDNASEVEEAAEAPSPAVRDPIEPVNRAIFAFNDKAYFWVMKPVAQGYGAIVPEQARVCVRNFFSNLAMPIRLVNHLLQGKLRNTGTELLRFTINSTLGFAGLFDVARKDFHIERRDEDLGRTLGSYGLGHGVYIVLPLLGPSSLRDAISLAGDAFLDPVNYVDGVWTVLAIKAYKTENEVSLRIGDYEDLKKASVDPYAALRDAYIQHRGRKRH
jgi:phospholipid-binding lipoprotein MlaA